MDLSGRYSRNEGIIGKEGTVRLQESTVMVAGIGGVGGFVCEALARAGVGSFILIDADIVEASNLNRQIIADVRSLGEPKSELMKNRIALINPDARCTAIQMKIGADNISGLPFDCCDYVVDAVDDVDAKVLLIEYAKKASASSACGRPMVISAMGAANKIDPAAFEVADIYDTSVDPLARLVRKRMRELGIDSLKVVYSKEQPIKSKIRASLSFVPSVEGLIMAGEVIKDLCGLNENVPGGDGYEYQST
jgi:tRNA A37 threonylcarbamoyladenosine dehydratase